MVGVYKKMENSICISLGCRLPKRNMRFCSSRLHVASLSQWKRLRTESQYGKGNWNDQQPGVPAGPGRQSKNIFGLVCTWSCWYIRGHIENSESKRQGWRRCKYSSVSEWRWEYRSRDRCCISCSCRGLPAMPLSSPAKTTIPRNELGWFDIKLHFLSDILRQKSMQCE